MKAAPECKRNTTNVVRLVDVFARRRAHQKIAAPGSSDWAEMVKRVDAEARAARHREEVGDIAPVVRLHVRST